jgi:hypothetical protein
MADTSVRVEGVGTVVKYLRDYEPEVLKQLRTDLQTTGRVIAANAAQGFALDPLERWHSGAERRGPSRMPGYNAARARAGVKPVTTLRPPRPGSRQAPVLRIQQMDAGGQVYDSAGSQSASRFIKNLDKRLRTKSVQGKTRSRVLFGGVKAQQEQIEAAFRLTTAKVDEYIERAILAG